MHRSESVTDTRLKDRYLTCQSCRNRFLYSREEQRQHADAARPPRICPACRALERLTRRRTGEIEWYSRQRGFGFIKQDDGSSVFLHVSAFQEPGRVRPRTGLAVSYHVQITDRGPRAVDVELDAEAQNS
jgi:cold shock protein